MIIYGWCSIGRLFANLELLRQALVKRTSSPAAIKTAIHWFCSTAVEAMPECGRVASTVAGNATPSVSLGVVPK